MADKMAGKKDLVLEIGCEEIPSRFMPPALKMLEEEACKMWSSSRLSYDGAAALGTPRRLILLVSGLASEQVEVQDKKKGPTAAAAFDGEGNPTRAARGFARSQGVAVSDLKREVLDGTEYVFAHKKMEGRKTRELLPELLPALVQRLTFPKPMIWESREVRFARPIRWLCSLYGEEPVQFSYAGVESAPKTYGHRFLSPGPHECPAAGNFLQILRDNYVLVDPEERREKILAETTRAARALGGEALMEEDLLTEVNYLVEYPLAVTGSYSRDYLRLPREVLITTMQSHQRFFPVQEAGGKGLLPHFITIANGVEHFRENVQKGNQRVLRARLADADFFYREDLKTPLEEKVEGLKDIVFQEDLGTLWQKTLRIRDISETLCSLLGLAREETGTALRAAFLSKGDLVTSMVYEFSELQGVMGREYALKGGEKQEVAAAIFEHYLPRFAGDEVPENPAGAVVALADKLDNIVASFARGKEPTGSQDPYALRRQALGIIAILEAREFSLALKDLLGRVYDRIAADAAGSLKGREETVERVFDFIRQRLKFVLLEEKLRYDVVDALIHSRSQDLYLTALRARELDEEVESEAIRELLKAYTRVVNLAARAPEGASVAEDLLAEPEERELYRACALLEREARDLLGRGDFTGFLKAGAGIRPAVDGFFDRIMVMVEEEGLRNNRLALLKKIRDLFLDVVDLGKIVSS